MSNVIVTITGPSAGGKSTLEKALVEFEGFYKVVSTTTREPREGEVEGVDYFFVTHEEFTERNREDGFIESVAFKGNGYAVDKDEIQRAFDAQKDVVIVCEPGGAKQIKRYCDAHGIKLVQVYITHHLKELVNRFVKRDLSSPCLTDKEARFKVERLQSIIDEHEQWPTAHRWDMEIEWMNDSNQGLCLNLIANQVRQMKSAAALAS